MCPSVRHIDSWWESDLLCMKWTLRIRIPGVEGNQANVNHILRNIPWQFWVSKDLSLHVPQTREAYHLGTVQENADYNSTHLAPIQASSRKATNKTTLYEAVTYCVFPKNLYKVKYSKMAFGGNFVGMFPVK